MSAPIKYRVAVIGRTGKGNYGHGLGTVWLKCDRAEIVAVADENGPGGAKVARELGAKVAYTDFREMLKKEKPQIVSVADRWPDCHRDMVVACAEHGASIFLEKPIARTLQEADEMVAACEKHHVKCALAHQTKYSPRVKVIKQLIADGRIGDVLELRGHGKEDGRGGGEDLMVLGSHTFNLMQHLAGPAKWCTARINQAGRKAVIGDARPGGEAMGPVLGDHIAATYGFDGLTIGSFVTHKAKAGVGSRYWFEIRGSKGLIQLGYGVHPAAFLCEDPGGMTSTGKVPWVPITSNGVGKPETWTPKDNGNLLIVDDLIDAIEKDRAPLDGIHDGRAALEMILGVYASHLSERLVELPLKNRRHPLVP